MVRFEIKPGELADYAASTENRKPEPMEHEVLCEEILMRYLYAATSRRTVLSEGRLPGFRQPPLTFRFPESFRFVQFHISGFIASAEFHKVHAVSQPAIQEQRLLVSSGSKIYFV